MNDGLYIEWRFRGPPESGNGGYSCGLLGVLFGEPAEVTLRIPPPLETTMVVEERLGGGLTATHGGSVIMEAVPVALDVDVPNAVTLAEAEKASSRFAGFHDHAFPACFVCGPDRDEGDGLRIFPGDLGGGASAAPWTPDGTVASSSGVVHPEIVWAALDCPTGWTTWYAAQDAGVSLLGRLAATIVKPVIAGSPHVAAAWPAGRDGRKHHATSAILSPDGEPHAFARATWVELKDQPGRLYR